MSAEQCIFCEILAGRAEASFVFQDERCAAFMDVQPVNRGHVLVIPRSHASGLGDVDSLEWEAVTGVARRVAAALREADVGCEGVNLFLADGRVAGQEVWHTHLHVIPRFANDGFGLRFPATYGSLPARPDLEAAAEELRRHL